MRATILVSLAFCLGWTAAYPIYPPAWRNYMMQRYAQTYPRIDLRYRRQDIPMGGMDPRMVQYQQLLQARQAQAQQRAQMGMPMQLAPGIINQAPQMPYDRNNVENPRLSVSPLPIQPDQRKAPLNPGPPMPSTKQTVPVPQPQTPKQQTPEQKGVIAHKEEMREAMEMFNEKVDLGLFVNNDIQPNVQMIGGKRSETPTVEKENKPEPVAAAAAVADDSQDHEIRKKSDISKAKIADLISSESQAAIKKDNVPAAPSKEITVQDEEGKRSMRDTITCQGEKEWLQCPTYHLIKVHSAFWGRDDQKACSRSGIVSHMSTEKMCPQDEANTMLKVQNSCDGENVCEVVASPLFFDRHDCPDTYKFLRLNWECARSESRIKESLERDAPVTKIEKKDKIEKADATAEEEIQAAEAIRVAKDKIEVPEEHKTETKESESSEKRDEIGDVIHKDTDYEKSISEVMVTSTNQDGTGFMEKEDDDGEKKEEQTEKKDVSKEKEEDLKQPVEGSATPEMDAPPENTANETEVRDDHPIINAEGEATPANATEEENRADVSEEKPTETAKEDATEKKDAEADAGTEAAAKPAEAEAKEAAKEKEDKKEKDTAGSGSGMDLMKEDAADVEAASKKSIVFVKSS